MSANPTTQTKPQFIIPAEAHTDNHDVEVKFDAVHWFRRASIKAIMDLAGCNWRGDYPADAVAEWEANRNPEMKRLFDYLAIVNKGHTVCGFECSVDDKAAKAWLENQDRRRNRFYPGAQLMYRHTLQEHAEGHTGFAEVVIETDESWASIGVWTPAGEHVGDVTIELYEGKLVARTWKKEDIDGDPTTRTELCDNPRQMPGDESMATESNPAA